MVEESVVEEVTGITFSNLLKSNPDNLVLDVRSRQDFDAGHITSAIHVDILSPYALDRLSQLEKATPILLYCNSGIRSRSACKTLISLGFSKVYHLTEGLNDWKEELV